MSVVSIFIHIHVWQEIHVFRFYCQELSRGCGNFKDRPIISFEIILQVALH